MTSMELFQNELRIILKAGVRSIAIESYEWKRCTGYLIQIMNKEFSDVKMIFINPLEGCKAYTLDKDGKPFLENTKQLDLLEMSQLKNTMIIWEEFSFVENERKLPFVLRKLPKNDSYMIFLSPKIMLPKNIEKDMELISLELPDSKEIERIYNNVESRLDLPFRGEKSTKIIDALKGLSTIEIDTAISKTLIQEGKLTEEEIPCLIKQKEQAVNKSGYLEYFHPKTNLNEVGGLDMLKDWLKLRYKAFHPKAKSVCLEPPKGVLLLGVPGTGKSLSAKAISIQWQQPLLRLDIGSLFGSLVGESESNIRNTLRLAEAMAPCVLWIDEIEKGLNNSSNDSTGVSQRILSTFLTWMQEKEAPVFIIATANDVTKLPPELLRKGRFDEIFFVDIPVMEERKEIIEILLKKVKQNTDNINLGELAEVTQGFSGAELDDMIRSALFKSFDPEKETIDLTTELLKEEIKRLEKSLISIMRKEDISKLRTWALDRAMQASKYPPEELLETKANKIGREAISNDFL